MYYSVSDHSATYFVSILIKICIAQTRVQLPFYILSSSWQFRWNLPFDIDKDGTGLAILCGNKCRTNLFAL